MMFKYKLVNTPPLTQSTNSGPGEKGNYSWIVRLYPPRDNAGAEWMAHAINSFLIRERGAKVNVIMPNPPTTNFERVKIFDIEEKDQITKVIDNSSILFSHLSHEAATVKTGALLKKPVILVMHNSFNYKHLEIYKEMLPNNLYLIHNSHWIKKYYEPLKIPSIVVHPPVDYRDYSVASSNEYITLINCCSNKGINTFINIAKEMPDFKFLGVKGAYDKQFTNTLPNILYIENTPNIKEIYGKTSIVLMPSKYESWGRVAVEAMSSGIPVIAHPTPGLLESCGEAGIFCDRNDTAAWVNEIRKLKSDKAYYEKYSALCKRRAQELNPDSQLIALSNWLDKIEWK